MPFVAVTRGDLVESRHDVAACAVDVWGRLALAYGDVDAPVYVRSAAKPFIAAAVVASGAAARFGLGARELAVMAASHGGEAFHVAAVRGILLKIGLGPEALHCGAHPPSYEPAAAELARSGEAPSALHNNCSGKHAGILALCAHAGFDVATYLDREHPAQRRILAFCARLTGDDPDAWPVGVDGCGIPVFATSLRRGALAFARFARPEAAELGDAEIAALTRVRAAIVAEPAYIGGTGRFDSALPPATGGAIVGKAGAEGVHGDAIAPAGLGLLLKVVDGSRRAVAPAAIAALGELGVLGADERLALEPFANVAVRNVAGGAVGTIKALDAGTRPPRSGASRPD